MSWVTIAEYEFYWQAEIAKSKLLSEEIRTIIADTHVSYTIGPSVGNGFRLQVERENVLRAKNILNKILGEN